MRLLFESENGEEMEAWKALLEYKGVPAFITGAETFRLSPQSVGYKLGLWLYFDAQLEDAQALLKDKNHTVTNPIDSELFRHKKRIFNEMSAAAIPKRIEFILNGIVLSVIAILVAWGGWRILSAV
jgi:hypothetical protein